MNIGLAFISLIAGYLIGAISFTRLIGRFIAPGEDLSRTEVDIPDSEAKFTISSVSATAIAARKGPLYGCTTGLLDMAKVALPAYFLATWYPGQPYYLIFSALAVVGHNWPVYYRFKGGRGMSPIIGGMLIIDWLGIVVTNVIGAVLGLVVFRNLIVMYLAWVPLLIPWLWYRTSDPWAIGYALVINLSLWIAQVPELKQHRVIGQVWGRATDSDMPVSERFRRVVKMYGQYKSKDEPAGE